MNPNNWNVPSHFPFQPPPPGVFDYEFSQRDSHRDSWSGISSDVERKVKVSPGKYAFTETRQSYNVNTPQLKIKNSNEVKRVPYKKKPAKLRLMEIQKPMQFSDDSPSRKVKMEIYLQRFKTGVFLTKVRVGDRVRWQEVKYVKQALRYHPAIKKFQTVMTAIDKMQDHRTLEVSLTKDEAARYKAGDLLEGPNRERAQPKSNIQVNNYYQLNNYKYNAGPSTSRNCIEDNNDCDSGDSDSSE